MTILFLLLQSLHLFSFPSSWGGSVSLMWTILKWRHLQLWGFKRNFCPSHNYVEESKLGIFLRTKIITRNEFCLNGLSVWQDKHLMTKRLPFLMLFSPLKLQTSIPFPSSEWHIYLILFFCLCTSHICGVPICMKLNFILFYYSVSCQFNSQISWKNLWRVEDFFLPHSSSFFPFLFLSFLFSFLLYFFLIFLFLLVLSSLSPPFSSSPSSILLLPSHFLFSFPLSVLCCIGFLYDVEFEI